MSVLRVVDNRLNAVPEQDIKYVVQEGAQTVSYVPLTASSYSNQNISWNLSNIADRTCRDPRLAITLYPRVTISVTNNSGATANFLDTGGSVGWKQYPINRSIANLNHQINQSSYSLNSNQIIDALARLNICPDNSDFYDNTCPDFIDSYENSRTTNMNPLVPYSSTFVGDGIFKPRSSGLVNITNNSVPNTNTAVIVMNWELYEPLISPFSSVGKDLDRGLYAITGEIINLTLIQDLTKILALAPPAGFTVNSIAVDFTIKPPVLNCIYLTPYESYMPEIPRESITHYNNYTVFSQDIGAYTAGSSNAAVTNVCNFTNMPSKILVYAKLSEGNITAYTPDKYLSFADVGGLSVQFDNGNPQFSSATKYQLYDVSKRNSLTMPRDAFLQNNLLPGGNTGLYGCGPVMVINPALDLNIRDGLASGSEGRFIFQATLNLVNRTATDFPGVTLFVVGINDSILERRGSEYHNYLVSLPSDISKMAHKLPGIELTAYHAALSNNMFLSGGSIGSFFKSLWNGIKKGGEYLWKNKNDILNVAKAAAPLVGLGDERMSRVSFKNGNNPERRMKMFYQ